MPRKISKKEVQKWDDRDMWWYVKSYCKDAKHQYLDQVAYKAITKRLTTRTGWTLQELEGWLAYQGFKACDGNRVLGSKRAREEAVYVAKGGPR